jgi:hypothetical protein
MFNHIKEKTLLFLKPSEATNHIRGEINLDSHIQLNLLLHKLINQINDVSGDEDMAHDRFIEALTKIAAYIETARIDAALFLKKKQVQKRFDLYLHALQLHLQNYDYYQSIGIDFFQDESPTGIPSNLFYNINIDVTCSGAKPSDYLNFISSPPCAPPDYITPDIIDKVTEFSIVYVTALSPNPYGHILLGLGDQGYIHINALYDKPQYIPREKFNSYLRDTTHMLLGVQQIYTPNLEGARTKLHELSQKPWFWRAYWANCANFSDMVLNAGGAPYAHIDPLHIGNYHHHTQYPAKRLACAHPLSLNKPQYEMLSTEDKSSLKNHHEDVPLKKHFKKIGKQAGLEGEKAKRYAHYRIHEGLSHKRAQHKVEPTWVNFLAMHHNKIENIALLHPLFFILASPLLLLANINRVTFHLRGLGFFKSGEKNKGKPESTCEMDKEDDKRCAITA